MAETFTYTTEYKRAKAEGEINLGSDTIRLLAMRSGFVFSDDCEVLANIKGSIGPIATISFVDGGGGNDVIHFSAGGAVAAGFIVGNEITVSGSTSNNVTEVIIAMTDDDIEIATGTLTTEAEGDSVTITAEDELATLNGYTKNTAETGTVTVTKDKANHRCDSTFPTATVGTASGGNIGPTPGIVVYNLTADIVIGYLDFGGELTIVPPDSLLYGSGLFRDA